MLRGNNVKKNTAKANSNSSISIGWETIADASFSIALGYKAKTGLITNSNDSDNDEGADGSSE